MKTITLVLFLSVPAFAKYYGAIEAQQDAIAAEQPRIVYVETVNDRPETSNPSADLEREFKEQNQERRERDLRESIEKEIEIENTRGLH